MDAEQFVQWLRGFADISGGTPDEEQWKSIKEQLAQVIQATHPAQPAWIYPQPTTQPAWIYPQPNYPSSPYTITC